MSDARWFEIDATVSPAVRHFTAAPVIFEKIPATIAAEERYVVEMAFLHTMLAGQTSLEATLLRILDLNGEQAPTGARWHADLIARAAHPIGGRPAILVGDAARAADETRRFRAISAHTYDDFDFTQAIKAVSAAGLIAGLLPSEIAQFRQAIDP